MAFDGKAFGAEIVGVVKDYLERNLNPALQRLDALERCIAELPTPKDGKDAKPEEVAGIVAEQMKGDLEEIRAALGAIKPASELPDIPALVKETVAEAVAGIPAPKDGQDADPEAVAAIVTEKISGDLTELRSAVEAIEPAPELPDIPAMIEQAIDVRGASPEALARVEETISAAREEFRAMIEAEMSRSISPQRTESLIEEEMAALARAEVDRAVAAIPVPQDGKSITAEDVRPIIEECVSRAVSALPVPKDGEHGKDGVGLAGAMIDRDGGLVVTLTDGKAVPLGSVVGRDGDPGSPGADGADGFGFDDLAVVQDGPRKFSVRFVQGERVKSFSFTMPVVLDRGVFKRSETYEPGDGVTWGGQFYIAQKATRAQPHAPEAKDDWRLAVKRGQDGKDGILRAEKGRGPVRVGIPKKDDAE